MDLIGSRLKHIKNELQDYIETRIAIKAIDLGEKITYLIGQFIQQLIGYTVLIIGLLFALIALALFLGDLLDSRALGYTIVAAPFVIAGLIMVITKPKSVAINIQDMIMEQLLDNLEDKEEQVRQLPSNETKK